MKVYPFDSDLFQIQARKVADARTKWTRSCARNLRRAADFSITKENVNYKGYIFMNI